MMKKTVTILLSAVLALSLCACSGKDSPNGAEGMEGGAEAGAQGDGTDTALGGAGSGSSTALGGAGSGTDTALGGAGNGTDTTPGSGTASSQAGETGGLRLLASQNIKGCHTADGYYYQTCDAEAFPDGSYGSNLMYMDFAAGQEVYLCSNAGCSHNTQDCTSVLPYEDFPTDSSLLFPWKDSLYILSKDFDNDGIMYYDSENSLPYGSEEDSAALYRMNPDGTGREKVYSFDPALTLEDLVLGDEGGIYVVTKKLTWEQDSTGTYVNSTERKLVYLDLQSKAEREICPLEFKDSVSWRLAGCYGNTLVLEGTDYGREISRQEYFSDDAYLNLYQKSRELFATLALDAAQPQVRYSISNQEEHYECIDGNMLYISDASEGSIKRIDLSTGEEKRICGQDGCFYIRQRIGNKLCCDSSTGDSTLYYIDVDTGEILHSPLTLKSIPGWSLEIRAVLDSEVLVIYDCEATPLGDEAYDITRYQYGLISQEDLFAGNDNFRKINMVGKGE